MKETVFVIGGCRSGKSGHALELAEQISETNRIFMATCIPYDDEMRQRVERHQEERSKSWSTVEVPVLLPEAITENSRKANVILVDCLTLWISNLLLKNIDMDEISGHTRRLKQSLETARCPIILVSNEVGTGIVPENEIARLFRDAAGFVNQSIAAFSDRVIWMVAGIPVTIK